MSQPFNTFTTGLPAAGTLGGTEAIPVVAGGISSQTTPAGLAAYATTLPNVWTASQEISDAEPRFLFNQSGAGADLKLWDVDVAAGVFSLRTRTDIDGVGQNWIAATRGSTVALSNISLGNATSNPTYTFLGTSAVTVNGSLTVLSANGTVSTKFVVNNNSVPANGINLPVANSLGFNTNTTLRGSFDANGNFILLYAECDQSKSVQAPTTGFTITFANYTTTLILNPAGTLSTGTVKMPATPVDGQVCRFSSSQIITTLTVSPNTSQTISNAPVTIAAGQGFAWIYHLATTNWFRLY